MRANTSRLAATIALTMLISLVATASAASADPIKGSQGTIVCGSTTYNVISPGQRSLTASDVNSTSEVLLILDKASSFPNQLLTLCTVYPPPPDQPFTGYFLITPFKG
jgi:hypothetical protein